jgi:hypothetical protein
MNTETPRYLGVFAFFETLPEPRVERTRVHPLVNILTIALLAMICVGEGWEDMEDFGDAKQAWLRIPIRLRPDNQRDGDHSGKSRRGVPDST